MAMGIVSKAEFDLELQKSIEQGKPGQITESTHIIQRGRGPTAEVPMGIRKLIASEALSGATHKELSREFGISESSVSAYKNGSTSTASYKNPNEELTKSNREVANRIIGKAQQKLIDTIDALTNEKIADSKGKELAAMARDMSSVVKNFTPQESVFNNQQVIIYKPRMHSEESYDVIEVSE